MADEFREDMVCERIREKFRQGVSQGERDDAFRGRHASPDRAQPRAEAAPDGRGVEDRDGLQKPLRDDPELDVAVVSVRTVLRLRLTACGRKACEFVRG